jgi:hypothetical protein
MKRFDAARGKTVAKVTVTEQRPLGHDNGEREQKEPLH